MTEGLWIAIAVIAVLVVAALIFGLIRYRRGRISLATPPDVDEQPKTIDRSGGYTASSGITFSQSAPPEAAPVRPRETPDTDDLRGPADRRRRRHHPARCAQTADLRSAAARAGVQHPVAGADRRTGGSARCRQSPELDVIAPVDGRLERLRGRLAKSQNALGKSVLGLLGGGDLDEESWEEVEDTLLIADLGPTVTTSVVEHLRSSLAASGVRTEADARLVLREALINELHPEFDRSIKALPHLDKPSVLLVVGVNGTGKTTTVGKLARVLVADGRRVVLGAADTFRAAAADQLQAWGSRVGAEVVRGAEGADPASVAFDAVDKGIEAGADVVVIDTAGRLHTKTGLMDELGKVKRVVSKRAEVDEVLLVLDATIGQNGLTQAKVFGEVVDITGVVLTKLDGTAKGGIVFRVQEELGVPVKLVGLGEGPDDLAPFEPAAFVDALLG